MAEGLENMPIGTEVRHTTQANSFVTYTTSEVIGEGNTAMVKTTGKSSYVLVRNLTLV